MLAGLPRSQWTATQDHECESLQIVEAGPSHSFRFVPFRLLGSNRRHVELFEARRISKYIDLDNLSSCDREGQHRKRLPVEKRDKPRGSIHERCPDDQAKP